MLTRSRAKLINDKRKKSERFNNYVSSLEKKYGDRFSGWAPSSKNIAIESITVTTPIQERSSNINTLALTTFDFTVSVRGNAIINNWFFINDDDKTELTPNTVIRSNNIYTLRFTGLTTASKLLISPYTIVYKERSQPRSVAGFAKNYFPWGFSTYNLEIPNNKTFTSFGQSNNQIWQVYKSSTPILLNDTTRVYFRFNIKQVPNQVPPDGTQLYIGFSKDLDDNGASFQSTNYPTLANTGLSGSTIDISTGILTSDANLTVQWITGSQWNIGTNLNDTTGLNFVLGFAPNRQVRWGYDINTTYALNTGTTTNTLFTENVAYLTIMTRSNTVSPTTNFVYTITQY